MLKEQLQELQIKLFSMQDVKPKEQPNPQIAIMLQKLTDSDRSLRMTLERLQGEHIRATQLQISVHEKEQQALTCLEVADRVCAHLARIQQEDKIHQLDKFDRAEFERNCAIIMRLRQ